MMRPGIVPFLALALTWGCTDGTPVAPVTPDPQLGVAAGTSGCYAVEIESHATGVFPSFTGELTGDLEGSTSVLFDFTQLRFDGITVKNRGDFTVNVTGGIVPELVGETFRLTNIPMNVVTRNGNLVVGRLRAADDVPAQANLTFKGVFNADGAAAPPFAVDLMIQGVICP